MSEAVPKAAINVSPTPTAVQGRELPLDHRVEAAHNTLVIGVTSRSNFPAMHR
jgi:hypothetical protein